MIDLSRSCSRHRPALVDFVDRGEVREGTAAALAHLDRCSRCTEVVESTILAITALRRLGETAREAEPSDEAWPRLRARILALRSRRSAVMSPLAGVAMSFAIVAVLIVPLPLGGQSLIGAAATPSFDPGRSVNPIELQIETDYIASVRRVESSGSLTTDEAAESGGELIRIYPDDIRPIRKEVGPSTTTSRPSEAS